MNNSFTSPPLPSPKLRLMCSNSGHIVPRPHDKTLCYIGGETRIVAVDRHTTALHNLKHILAKTLNTPTTSFLLKYQLPLEDLDSLISLTSDEDLENMFQEFDRLSSSKNNNSCSSRIRLFIFPNNPDPVGGLSMPGFESLTKSDDWFVNALNGTATSALFSDTSSLANCLLNLDDDDDDGKIVNCKSVTGNGSGQDVSSVPGSPMMETTSSSFGSGSSNPSFVNLRPIRVNANDVVLSSPVPSQTANPDQTDPFLFYQERSEQKVQQKQFTGFDLASTDSVLSDSTITDQLSQIQVQSCSNNNQVAVDPSNLNQNTRDQMIQQQQKQYSACLLPMPSAQIQPPQYINHHHQQQPSGAAVAAAPSYYQQYYSHQRPANQQNFMYYVPMARQPPQGYNNFPLQQSPTASNNQAVFPSSAYIATNTAGSPKLVRVLSGRQYVGYSEINNPSHPQFAHDR